MINQMDVTNLFPSTKSLNHNGRILWPGASLMKQQFNLPDSVIYYILKNPSTAKCYLKLSGSCKYFFEKNPILIVEHVYKWRSKIYFQAKGNRVANIDFAKLLSKIWLPNKVDLSLSHFNPNLVTLFLLKIYRCENILLCVTDWTMTINDLQLLASKFEKLHFNGVRFTKKDDKDAMLENVLESIPNVKVFYYIFRHKISAVASSTMRNINKFNNLGDLRKIVLYGIPEIINVDDLGEFIKKHTDKKIWLTFVDDISEEYKIKLDKLVDAVVESGVPHRVISFPGLNLEKIRILQSRSVS